MGIIWKRIAGNSEDCWKTASIAPTEMFHYRQVLGDTSIPGIPSYHSNTLWGNTFCQGLTVGLASYHFLPQNQNEEINDDAYHAYISYEHPRTSQWPPLDNGR